MYIILTNTPISKIQHMVPHLSTKEARKCNLSIWWKGNSIKNTKHYLLPVGERVLLFLRMFCICPDSLYLQQSMQVESLNSQAYNLLLPFLANEKCFISILKVGKWRFREQYGVSGWLRHVWRTSSPKKKRTLGFPRDVIIIFRDLIILESVCQFDIWI